ncbi:MAG TPA: phosphoribosyltransferase family protein [Nocardioidaceae bacterium]|nr:phosphoribosyltransferase family protein [Nocardioidaceae bacterium]
MYRNRRDAGRRLADHLQHLRGPGTVVLGLPRGGVPVAYEVATALGAPLDVIMVRKLGLPFQPELAMGAIGEGGVRVLDPDLIRMAGVSESDLEAVERREREVLQRRAETFRAGRAHVPLEGKTVVIVDDGIATGSTAQAACQVASAAGARRIVLAVPVAPPDVEGRFRGYVDELVCPWHPHGFSAIGQFYADFSATSDEEVVDLLDRAGVEDLPGQLNVPAKATGIVLFAHGSGSSQYSPRNQYVARVLNRAGVATLLFDLLTPEEERDRGNVFDVQLLADRLEKVTRQVHARPDLKDLRIGYFGASTGAAAALWAAAEMPDLVGAVVSRGGRPDLAEPRLREVRAPTLLVVGGRDTVVLELNRRAQRLLTCENQLSVVPGATHLFEEPGTLQRAAELASGWFAERLRPVVAS